MVTGVINEFNHFEGNLSIFQPAIDITDHALGKEKTDLLSFIDALQQQQAEDTNGQDAN